MFTGLVGAVGTVTRVAATARGLAITIAVPWKGLARGESIAIDGACLTVVKVARGAFQVEAIATTRSRTLFGDFRKGRTVNLERALRLGDRLGGHLVAGHVDGVGTISRVQERGDALLLDIRVPAAVARFTVLYGSITVDGVSLTVNALPAPHVVQVAIIPHTRAATTLGGAVRGRRVHLEADMIGRFVGQLVSPYRASRRKKA